MESPVKQLALQARVPICQPDSLRSGPGWTALCDLSPDLIVVAAYGLILPAAVLALPRYACINVHGSLLPRHRGAA